MLADKNSKLLIVLFNAKYWCLIIIIKSNINQSFYDAMSLTEQPPSLHSSQCLWLLWLCHSHQWRDGICTCVDGQFHWHRMMRVVNSWLSYLHLNRGYIDLLQTQGHLACDWTDGMETVVKFVVILLALEHRVPRLDSDSLLFVLEQMVPRLLLK